MPLDQPATHTCCCSLWLISATTYPCSTLSSSVSHRALVLSLVWPTKQCSVLAMVRTPCRAARSQHQRHLLRHTQSSNQWCHVHPP